MMDQEKIILRIPVPPSVNKAYANTSRGRVKTRDTSAWFGKAFAAAGSQVRHLGKLMDANLLARHLSRGPKGKHSPHSLKKKNPFLSYHLDIIYHFPDDSVRDILNFDKLVPDFLVDIGILLDDCFIDDCRQRRGLPDLNDPHVTVEIITIDNMTRSR